jgi:hypothetical protein
MASAWLLLLPGDQQPSSPKGRASSSAGALQVSPAASTTPSDTAATVAEEDAAGLWVVDAPGEPLDSIYVCRKPVG